MTAYDSAAWEGFAFAQIGASAALLGLVVVGLSINLRELIASRQLVNRGAEAVVVLGSVLMAATVVAIPEQSHSAVGIELLVVGAFSLLFVALLQRGAGIQAGAPPGSLAVRRTVGLGAQLLVIVAGVTLLVHAGGGLYWWPAAVVASFTGGLTNVWVLLIEILR